MHAEIKTIVEDGPPTATTNTQKVNKQERRVASKRVLMALSGKQKEPNRGQGTERRPSSPRPHVTGPQNRVTEGNKEDYKKIVKGRKLQANTAAEFTNMGEFQRNPVFELTKKNLR